MKRIALYTAITLATLLSLFLLWQLRLIVFFFILSLFIAAVIRPGIDYFDNFGLPRTMVQIILYLLIVTTLVLSLYMTSNSLAQNAQQLLMDVQDAYERIYTSWADGSAMQQNLVAQLPKPAGLIGLIPGLRPDTRVLLFGITQGISTVISGLSLAVILSIYWSASQARFERLWLSVLPSDKRKTARNVWRQIETQLGSYISSQLLQSIIIGLTLGVTFWLLGLPYAALLALTAAIAKFIPLIGALTTILLVFLAGLNISLPFAVIAAILTATILHLIWLFIRPYLFQSNRYSSLLVILLIIPFVEIFGILGLVFAPPFAVAVQLLLAQWFDLATKPAPTKKVEITSLKERLAELKARSLQENEEPSSELNNLIQRLEKLLNDPVIDANVTPSNPS